MTKYEFKNKNRKFIQFFLIINFIFILVVGCFKDKVIEDNEKTDKGKQVKSKIFDLYKKNLENKEKNYEKKITLLDLSKEERQKLFTAGIDPNKVSKGIKLARGGDLDSILSLAQLFYSIGEIERAKSVLEIGVIENYPEAIYNLAIVYKKEKDNNKYDELLKMLPENYFVVERKNNDFKLDKGIDVYNKGVDFLKEKKYDEAIETFQESYNLGVKDADIKIAHLYREKNNIEKSLEWFEKANKRGNKEARYMLGLTYFENYEFEKAIPYLEKSYKGGYKKIAILVALSYEKTKNSEMAMKWYKIAEKNGDKEATKIIADMENTQSKKLDKVDSIFGNLSKEYTILDSTLESTLNPKKEIFEDNRPETKGEYKILDIKGSSALKKKNYNVRMDEILNKEIYLIK